ncbi:MAG: septal ring lytic transglycosylase RlpA family protein [Methylacidiphilales bacterium]|nr:septal ring lytic transglycosylase RlpA family protein [Candidatus Methylacidiphilales bacterium]MDW8350100.1 septal ring lytic transglycosylase RlpA family protein [Verrucomicrobiae bacterium]
MRIPTSHAHLALAIAVTSLITSCAPPSKRFYVSSIDGSYSTIPPRQETPTDHIEPVPLTPVEENPLPRETHPAPKKSSKKFSPHRKAEQRPVIHDNTTTGIAICYNDESEGKITASGEIYRHNKLTAAHRTLPFGTRVRVTHLENNTSVILRINDRGPKDPAYILEISRSAALALGIQSNTTAAVKIEVLD